MTEPEIAWDERGSSPLELLFDLTYAVSVGVAADHFAELVGSGQIRLGLIAFAFSIVAILVAWINYSWFASAFDHDDWFLRLCTMVQMVGVIILALGLPATFESVTDGKFVDIRLLVTGYIVMRAGMVALWIRTARSLPQYRDVAQRSIIALVGAQLGWIALSLAKFSLGPTIVAFVVLGGIELAAPLYAQGKADGTPWHPLHIADRYRAFAIITLGEGVIGTVSSSGGLLGGRVSIDGKTALVIVAGIGITFAVWWIYFSLPFGEMLIPWPTRGYVFGYGHILVFAAIASIGAGLRIAGNALAGHNELSHMAVTVSVAAPVAIYLATTFSLATLLGWRITRLRAIATMLTGLILVGAVVLACFEVPIEWTLMLVMVAALFTVVAWESNRDTARLAQEN